MAHLTGPDFIGVQSEDLAAAEAFYNGVLGLPIMQKTPDAVVFATTPIPFAVRTPLGPLSSPLGSGIALWFGCEDADALHKMLDARGTPIVFPPKDGPFGRYFAFRDPLGYTITAHTK